MSYAQPNYHQARCGPAEQKDRAMTTNGSRKDTRFEPPAENDAKELEKIAKIIDAFRHVDSKIPSSYMAAFLRVALEPGRGPTEYAQKLNTRQPIASRILLEMGKIEHRRDWPGEPHGRTGQPSVSELLPDAQGPGADGQAHPHRPRGGLTWWAS
jgi:hypothetical protein